MWFGLSLQFWQTVFFWSTAVAAIFGAIGIGAALVSAVVGYEISDFVQAEANARIAEANASGKQAGEEAAKANERAAQANEKAEAERLERLKLEAEYLRAGCRATSNQAGRHPVRSAATTPIAVVSRLLDPEGKDFADDIGSALTGLHWQVTRVWNWTKSEKGVFIRRR